MDTAKLQATVDSYKAQIASKQGELDKLTAKIKELQPDLIIGDSTPSYGHWLTALLGRPAATVLAT